MTATTAAAPVTQPATTAPPGRLLRTEPHRVSKRPTVSTPARTEDVKASRDDRISARLVADGLLVDPAGTSAPDVVATLVRAWIPTLTGGVEALRNNRISARPLDDGLLVDPADTTAPDMGPTPIRAAVPVHEARRADLEKLFARPAESAPDDDTSEGDAR